MLRIELSALSAQELRRLLEAARARNQTALIEQLETELQARPTRAQDWTPAAMSFAPLPDAEPVADGPPTHRRRNSVMAATAVLAAFVSAAVTWGLSVPVTPQESPAPAAQPEAPPRADVVLASLAPVAPPANVAEAPPAVAEPVKPEGAAPAARRPVRVAKATPQRRARENPCLDLATAAERLVCGYPSLAAQDRELRAAYERALAAGADRRELDRAQAAWRSGGEQVANREQLADRYSRRIRELEAAAVRPPPEEPPY